MGTLKLQVSFAKYRFFCRALFAEETYNLKEPTNRSHCIPSLFCWKCSILKVVLVGSLKLSVSFAKEPYKRDYILQKRPII